MDSNVCDFIGYFVESPELKKNDKDVPYLVFDLDIIRYYNRKDGTQAKEKVTATFEVWDSAAEYIAERAEKGTRISITSSLRKSNDKPVFRVNKFRIFKKKDS